MRASLLLATLVVLTAAVASAQTADGAAAVEKKLIEYGWDVPTPEFIRANIRAMEELPFDGLIFRMAADGRVLTPAVWDEAAYAADFENLRNIDWKKFTDNFLILWAASAQDWFNDEHWAAIEQNTRIGARAARLARCVGICFDPEPYGDNPWDYSKAAHKDTKSFAEYEVMARRRGVQFMRALESEFPGLTILTFYQWALFGGLCHPMPPAERAEALSQNDYALYPAFLEGMLGAAGPGVTLVDGNENAYYYQDSSRYFDAYHLMTQRALHLVAPALWDDYRRIVRAGQALYVDQYFGLRAEKVLGNFMMPEERPKWFEHNAYWALSTTDRYVWCYSERMNWWTNTDVPPGAREALVSAREKVRAGQSLDFDLQPTVAAAEQRRKETPPQ